MATATLSRSARENDLPTGIKQWLNWRYVYGLLRDHPFGNLLLLGALVIGFFHGWLKLRHPGGLTVYAYDIPLALALVLVLIGLPATAKWFPPSRVGKALQVVVGVCVVYALVPTEIPWLVRLAAFRGWAMVPLMYLLGYHLFRSRAQLELYGWVILLLAVATSIYGARQDPEELRRMAAANASLEVVMRGSFYAEGGETKFRVFSTFVSAGAFGGTMAYSLLIGLAKISDQETTKLTRALCLVLMVPVAYGLFLSGSRGAIVIGAVSVIMVAWYRRNWFKYLILPALLLGTLSIATALKSGGSMYRLQSAFQPSELFSRAYIVVNPAFHGLLEYPLGGGLGRSGHGLPNSLGYLIARFNWRPVDGDVGRVAMEMGLIGLIVFAALFIAGVSDSFYWMKRLRGTPLATSALTCGAMFVAAFLCFPVGSPFLAIPVGAIIWFHLGALNRLFVEYTQHEHAAPPQGANSVADLPAVLPPPTRTFLYGGRGQNPAAKPASARPRTREKRFMYHKPKPPTGPH